MKVYVVTRGDYSDIRIEGVFSTREMADKYVAIHDCNNRELRYFDYGYTIEEYDVDSRKLYTDEELWYKYTIRVDKKFVVEEIRPILKSFVKDDYITYNEYNGRKYFIVYSKTKDLKMKTISDKYIKAMANEVLE